MKRESLFSEPVTRCRVRWQVRLMDGLFLLLVAGAALAAIRWIGVMMVVYERGSWGR